jgi:hypothetical protein
MAMYLLTNGASALGDWLNHEVFLSEELAVGATGLPVRRVQEWLTVHGHALAVDGDFGAITAEVVARFQAGVSLPSTGRVDGATFSKLSAPMLETLRPRAGTSKSLNATVLEYARAHLARRPLELGGQNRGPWVRMYMTGREGAEWPWCAGFATFVLHQACESLNLPMPFPGSVSCDTLAAQAKAAGLFVSEAQAKHRPVPAGSLFLVRRTDTDWTHTGIVESAEPLLFKTIEGNSNDAGEREGYEVCSISRGYTGKDFIVLTRD